MHIRTLVFLALFAVAKANILDDDFIKSGCKRTCRFTLWRLIRETARRFSQEKIETSMMDRCEDLYISFKPHFPMDSDCPDVCNRLKDLAFSDKPKDRYWKRFKENMFSENVDAAKDFCDYYIPTIEP